MMKQRTCLLDLHWTFALPDNRPLTSRIPEETYRTWIRDLLIAEGCTVVMTTARPDRYRAITLDRIAEATGWGPHAAFFRTTEGEPHEAKEENLKRIIAQYGEPDDTWFGLESNSKTQAMYRKYGIRSMRVPYSPPVWTELPFRISAGDPFTLPGL